MKPTHHLLLLLLLSLVTALVLLPPYAVAQEPTPASTRTQVLEVLTTVAATPLPASPQATTPAATPTPQALPPVVVIQPPTVDPQHLPWLTGLTLLFALVALTILFSYARAIQLRFYEATERLGYAGRTVRATMVEATVGTRNMAESGGNAMPELRIEGPAIVPVGAESAEFSAAREDGKPALDATWQVTPPTAALVSPTMGAKVRVIAAVAGTFALSATTGSPNVAGGEVRVAAVVPSLGAVELPFIGRGYGSIALAIVLVAAVIILGLAGILGGGEAATLLGALLGYIFGVTSSATQRSGSAARADD